MCLTDSLTELANRRAYRYGGEGFAIVLNNTNLNGSLIVAEKMREWVKQLEFTFESGLCTVTIRFFRLKRTFCSEVLRC
ncbi:MAG: diguanylate cyclase [bacterium]|nr:diguanylate cyclase [bacterium]